MSTTEVQKRAYSFAEFAKMFSISLDSVKRLWRKGELVTITVGARRLVPFSEVLRIEREGIGTPRKRRAARETSPQVNQ